MLVHLRESQFFAEVLGVLVDGEARRQRRYLEQDSARLAEVDRAKVVAVLDVGHEAAGVADALLPREVVVVLRRPRDVMDTAGALGAAYARRRVVAPAEAALGAFEAVLALPQVSEPERVGEELLLYVPVRAVGARALDADDGVLGRYLGVLGAERIVALLRHDEL